MAEHPILFNTEMVKAILDGRKTMTRRVIQPQPVFIEESGRWRWPVTGAVTASREWFHYMDSLDRCPYGKPGDMLWVRETWNAWGIYDHVAPKDLPHDTGIAYSADMSDPHGEACGKLRPSIHMPRWASRITLEVTSVRVERLQSGGWGWPRHEGYKEGVVPMHSGITHIPDENGVLNLQDRLLFSRLWDTINAKRGYSWDNNPWVWVVEFKVI